MSMSARAVLHPNVLGLGAVAAAAVTAMLVVMGADTDRTLANSYGRTLAENDVAWSRAARPENVWLSKTGDGAVPMHRAVTAGDRISIGRNGDVLAYQVVAVEQLEGDPAGLAGLRIQVVTARPDGAPHDETVRFLFAVEAPAATSPPPAKSDKVL